MGGFQTLFYFIILHFLGGQIFPEGGRLLLSAREREIAATQLRECRELLSEIGDVKAERAAQAPGMGCLRYQTSTHPTKLTDHVLPKISPTSWFFFSPAKYKCADLMSRKAFFLGR